MAEDTSTTQAPEAVEPHVAADKPRRTALAEWAITIILLLFATTTLVQSYVIPTVSMEDTLLRGDHLLVDKLSYAPGGGLSSYILPYQQVERGDIIVFRWPIDVRQNYVKRVVGVPGDRLRIVNKQLYLNGTPLVEPYAIHKTPYFDSYRDNFPGEPNVRLEEPGLAMLEENVVNGELVVPPDHYFVMGDNRDNSLDSRYWGFVPRQNIIGKPLMIYWSYDAPTERLADPNIVNLEHLADLAKNFFTKTRWERTFKIIRAHTIK
ncbi:MAG: signal peptidase I [Rhodospirillales bacterium]